MGVNENVRYQKGTGCRREIKTLKLRTRNVGSAIRYLPEWGLDWKLNVILARIEIEPYLAAACSIPHQSVRLLGFRPLASIP